MIAFSRIRSTAAVLVVAVLAVLPNVIYSQVNMMMSLIPKELLEMVPDVCHEAPTSEFPIALSCAIENLGSCSGLLQVLPNFMDLPSPENVTECEDIQVPFCGIASTCMTCMQEFDDLIRCIVLFDDMIDANVTELVDGCNLDVC